MSQISPEMVLKIREISCCVR